MNVDQRTCLRCGQPLPEGASCSRRYCDACGKQRNIELTRARQERQAKQRQAVSELKQWIADKRYCRKCEFSGTNKYCNNLCDYMLITGHRRGCRAGVGCKKRKIA